VAKKEYETKAEEMGALQRDISISEFFTKNRHLLGFDSPKKALMMSVKEAVDNSLDACEEAGILPDIYVEISQVNEDRYKLIVEDNGPGIIKEQIPNIFGKLLYGSKFHRLKMSRGQQGIGISASILYGQLTTGKNAHIISKISPKHPAQYYELHLDTKYNQPKIVSEKEVYFNRESGTRVEFELEAKYQKGKQSVDEYLKETALSNPHARLSFKDPSGEMMTFPRVVHEEPKQAKEIKPHPYGIELGILIRMLHSTQARSVKSFLQEDFSRISSSVAAEICTRASISALSRPSTIVRDQAEKLYKALQETKLMAPPTDCLVPIGDDALQKGMKKEIDAEFFVSITRPPAVYRGNPFQIEVGIAYGGNLDKEETIRVIRFANRVPLLYQQGACASTRALLDTNWKSYYVNQSKGNLPYGPLVIVIHMVSVWVPFTSEAKEAIANYDEIIKEMKLALQDCGRKVASYIRKTVKVREQKERASLLYSYIKELSRSLGELAHTSPDQIENGLIHYLEKKLPLVHERGENAENKTETD